MRSAAVDRTKLNCKGGECYDRATIVDRAVATKALPYTHTPNDISLVEDVDRTEAEHTATARDLAACANG